MPSSPSSIFIIFGEVFPKGYIQGLIAQAKKHNAKIIYSTMGRRTLEQQLRPLNEEELAKKCEELNLSDSSLLINIPLEAGFDLEPYEGKSLVDCINQYGLKTWEDFSIKDIALSTAKKEARIKFKKQIQKFLNAVSPYITEDIKDIHFIHTMAGGIPRAKLLMAVLNKVLKGHGKRFYSSKQFCATNLGTASLESFQSVTADSFEDLITETKSLRDLWTKKNINVSYAAFGYRGNCILVKDKYQWAAYAPYIQGWAKLALEDIAKQAQKNNIIANVFNCPEVLTRSSQAFSGIEVFLYPLLNSLNALHSEVILKKIGDLSIIQDLLKQLKTSSLEQNAFAKYFQNDFSFEALKQLTDHFFTHPSLNEQLQPKLWPQHNNPEQMNLMIEKTLKLNQYTIPETKLLLYTQLSTILIYLAGNQIYKQLHSKQAVHHLTHKNLLQ
ncbi:MAG: hypothetical protein HAW63_00525 [Bdellovibrionaceae bacterium]|nr:hypothetical protein [Pseudobdellovibrionaceae bacterium]